MGIHELNEKFTEPLHQLMLEAEAEAEADTLHLPIVRNLKALTDNIKVGHEFVVTASVEQCTLASVQSSTGNIVLLAQDPATHTFRLRAEMPGGDRVAFAFAHVTSGKVVSREVEVHAT